MAQTKILLIMGVCALVLLAYAWRRRAEWLLNLLLRGVLGAVQSILSILQWHPGDIRRWRG